MPIVPGAIISAADALALPRTYVRKKAATQSVVSSTTLVDDADFLFDLAANKVYWVSAHLSATGATAADIKIAWAVTGGVAALGNRQATGPGATTTSAADGSSVRMSGAHGLTTALQYGTDGTNGSTIRENFLVETTTAGAVGTLKLQFAQQVSNATAAALTSASFVALTEVELL